LREKERERKRVRERKRERERERASFVAVRHHPPPAFNPGKKERERKKGRAREREKKKTASSRIGSLVSSRHSSTPIESPASFFNFAAVHVARAARGASREREIDRPVGG